MALLGKRKTMSSKPEPDFVDLFEIPTVHLDTTLSVVGVSQRSLLLNLVMLLAGLSQRSAPISTNENSSGKPQLASLTAYALLSSGGLAGSICIAAETLCRSVYRCCCRRLCLCKGRSHADQLQRDDREAKSGNQRQTAQVNIWRDRIQRELQQAATVQDLLVPKHVRTHFLDSRCEPLQELSG